jgi:hypothetical protein
MLMAGKAKRQLFTMCDQLPYTDTVPIRKTPGLSSLFQGRNRGKILVYGGADPAEARALLFAAGLNVVPL